MKESAIDLMRRFFKENPFEELTTKQIAEKFNLRSNSAQTYVGVLQREGLIQREIVYRRKA